MVVLVCRCQPQSSVPSQCIVVTIVMLNCAQGATVLVWISCEDDRCQEEVEASSATTSFLSFFNAIFHLEIDQLHSITMYCCRFIYWNSHFYGSNFYGWSIGDIKSLSESGPFHSQGDYADS